VASDRPPPPGAPAPAPVLAGGVAAALVFLASGSVLVLEILGVRLLAPYVGLTLETTTAIIGAVLAGIAAGAAAGGWAADRVDARRLLVGLLAAGGLLALATVPLVRGVGRDAHGDGDVAALSIAMLALFPPAAALSAVTPVVTKLQLRDLQSTGAVVGRLSAWATAGALLGTFGTGFVLVPLMPTSAAVLGVGGLLLLAAAGVAARLTLAARGAVAGCLVAAAGLSAATLAAGAPCDAESAYHCARILSDPARPDDRVLLLDDLAHSYVDLREPQRLAFDYTRWIGDAVDGLAPRGAPVDAVFLGGGGFTLPRWLRATRPGSRATVLEVDADLVDLARRRLGLRTGPGLRVRVGDARVTLRDRPDASADLVVGDAFGGRSLPWHLATREFARDVRRVLRPGGLYALNVIDQRGLELLRAEAATLLDVFADVRLVAKPARGRPAEPRGGNLILLASERRLPARVRARSRGARTYGRAAVRRIAGGAAALRDDDAPADQLLSAR
jgi:spermidine synthase